MPPRSGVLSAGGSPNRGVVLQTSVNLNDSYGNMIPARSLSQGNTPPAPGQPGAPVQVVQMQSQPVRVVSPPRSGVLSPMGSTVFQVRSQAGVDSQPGSPLFQVSSGTVLPMGSLPVGAFGAGGRQISPPQTRPLAMQSLPAAAFPGGPQRGSSGSPVGLRPASMSSLPVGGYRAGHVPPTSPL